MAQAPAPVQTQSWMDRAKVFLGEVKLEATKKVTWPTMEELKEMTIVVLVTCLVISVFIFVVDFILNRLVNLVL